MQDIKFLFHKISRYQTQHRYFIVFCLVFIYLTVCCILLSGGILIVHLFGHFLQSFVLESTNKLITINTILGKGCMLYTDQLSIFSLSLEYCFLVVSKTTSRKKFCCSFLQIPKMFSLSLQFRWKFLKHHKPVTFFIESESASWSAFSPSVAGEAFPLCTKVRATGNDCCCDFRKYGFILALMNSS